MPPWFVLANAGTTRCNIKLYAASKLELCGLSPMDMPITCQRNVCLSVYLYARRHNLLQYLSYNYTLQVSRPSHVLLTQFPLTLRQQPCLLIVTMSCSHCFKIIFCVGNVFLLLSYVIFTLQFFVTNFLPYLLLKELTCFKFKSSVLILL